jgi:hypothetical protein
LFSGKISLPYLFSGQFLGCIFIYQIYIMMQASLRMGHIEKLFIANLPHSYGTFPGVELLTERSSSCLVLCSTCQVLCCTWWLWTEGEQLITTSRTWASKEAVGLTPKLGNKGYTPKLLALVVNRDIS